MWTKKILYKPLKNKISPIRKKTEKSYDVKEKIINNSDKKLNEGGHPMLKILNENHQNEKNR